MSYAINREEYNEIFHLGLATIRQGLVPPTWSFYEEGMDQYYIEYDVDLANELLDEMGLEWDADKEWRLRPDGERLTLYTETSGENQAFGLVVSYWKEVGLEVKVKPVDQALYREHLLAGDLDVGTWGGGSPTEVGAHGSVPMRLVPPWHWAGCCALAGLPWWDWYDSQGEAGEEPPPIIQELFAALDDYYAAPLGTEAYEKAGKEMVRINAENLWWFVVVGLTPAVTAMGNEVRNIREGEGVTFDVCVAPWTPELLWIEA
jgi:peptide/nickel transport system substrate-binding protein